MSGQAGMPVPPRLACGGARLLAFVYGKIFWMTESADTAWIVQQAKSLGFDLCGVVRPDRFPELQNTPEWLDRGYAGEMKYLLDQRRTDPRSVMPEMRSVIVC